MATFVEVVPDPFATNFDKAADSKKSERGRAPGSERTGRFDHVRRPVRGIELKDDTYATIQLVTSSGKALPLIDAAGQIKAASDGNGMTTRFTTSYSNFLIQQINEQRVEKQQIVVTFGEPYIFFFGEQPRVINVQGVLLNTNDFNWRAEWLENYDKYLRGTQCVRNKARVYLSWDDIITEGYIMSCETGEQAPERNYVTFGFQLFLTNYQNISGIGDPEAHFRGKAINLDPSQIDALGAASAGFQSSALAVRQANIAEAKSRKGLLAMLRDGQVLSAFEAGTSRLVEIQGDVQNLIDKAADFVVGRNIRVPRGFEGSAAFDSDIQLDASSLLPGVNDGEFVVNGITGGKPFTIRAQTGSPATKHTLPNGGFGPLSLNTDEFVARGSTTSPPKEFVDFYKHQRGDQVTAAAEVRRIFKVFGIDTEPPSEVMRLIGRATFGVVNYVGGEALGSIQSQGARQAINVIPQALI